MVSAQKLPLMVLALGASLALPVVAEEVVTWTRDLAVPPKLAPEPVPSGLVVITRETNGPTQAELKERLLAQMEKLEREQYAQSKLAEQAAELKVQSLAEKTQAELERTRQELEAKTAEKIAVSAEQNAKSLRALQGATSQMLGQLQTQVAMVSASALQPDDVKALAAQTVAEAEPAFEALALNTLKDAEGYVRTVARQAVTDKDPAMASALGEAVAVALNEEQSPAAFSMRRAIVNELTNVVQGKVSGTTAATTRLGDDVAAVEPAAGNEEVIDAARLRLGRLLNPGVAPTDNATQMATLMPNHDPRESLISAGRARARTDLMDLRDYKVVLHADNLTLPAMLSQIIERAEPFAGPWQVRWRLKPENEDLMTERFSLDAETTFSEFVSYLAQYLINDRGVKLTFSLFDRERVVLVSD